MKKKEKLVEIYKENDIINEEEKKEKYQSEVFKNRIKKVDKEITKKRIDRECSIS